MQCKEQNGDNKGMIVTFEITLKILPSDFGTLNDEQGKILTQ
jgi:hypothetical protein